MLKAGDVAPEFDLPDADMEHDRFGDPRRQSLRDLFLPERRHPGCTMEGIEFTELMGEFEERGVSVIGVSKDTCVSHAALS